MPLSTAFATLQELTRHKPAGEHCDLCSVSLTAGHEHLVEPAGRRVVCVCLPCAILFSAQSGQRYKRVPKEMRALADFRMSDANWESLTVPINLAFFFRNGETGGITALFPSPGGATESVVPIETWELIRADNPVLQALQPDIEALLVNRLGSQRGFAEHQYFLAPIDECFKLVGLVRANWRGLSGGDDLWCVLREFFTDLTRRSAGEVHYA